MTLVTGSQPEQGASLLFQRRATCTHARQCVFGHYNKIPHPDKQRITHVSRSQFASEGHEVTLDICNTLIKVGYLPGHGWHGPAPPPKKGAQLLAPLPLLTPKAPR